MPGARDRNFNSGSRVLVVRMSQFFLKPDNDVDAFIIQHGNKCSLKILCVHLPWNLVKTSL